MAFPNEDTQFKKGQSGNPKGRPKKIPDIDNLLAEVLGEETGDEALEILKALLKKAKKGDVRAAEVLLDRAYGKARQHIDQNTEHSGCITITWQEPPIRNTGDKGSD